MLSSKYEEVSEVRKNKPISEYHKRGTGLKARCKGCCAEAHAAYYKINSTKRKKSVAENNKKLRAKKKKKVEALKDVPCMDCGRRFPPYAMDFDHVSGAKEFNISAAVHHKGASMVRIAAEIEKCEIVCACCHRIRTHKRKQYTSIV